MRSFFFVEIPSYWPKCLLIFVKHFGVVSHSNSCLFYEYVMPFESCDKSILISLREFVRQYIICAINSLIRGFFCCLYHWNFSVHLLGDPRWWLFAPFNPWCCESAKRKMNDVAASLWLGIRTGRWWNDGLCRSKRDCAPNLRLPLSENVRLVDIKPCWIMSSGSHLDSTLTQRISRKAPRKMIRDHVGKYVRHSVALESP